MKNKQIQKLKQKGWSEKDIMRTEEIINARHKFDKSRTVVHMSRIIYWTALLVIVIGNFVISMVLIPFLLVLNKFSLDIIIVTIGFGFGLLFNLIINDIEHIERKHHLFALIMIPILAIANFVIMVNIANSLGSSLNLLITRENPYFISILYIIAFIIPYLWTLFVRKKINEQT